MPDKTAPFAAAPLAPTAAASPQAMSGGHEDWPFDALKAFSLRMARLGQPVSTRLMAGNRLYALQQLELAHAAGDQDLRELALALFRHFERQRSGLPGH